MIEELSLVFEGGGESNHAVRPKSMGSEGGRGEGGHIHHFQNVQKNEIIHIQVQNNINGARARIPSTCVDTKTKCTKFSKLSTSANEDKRGISAANQRRARSVYSDGDKTVVSK